jgi:hypothetical protein
MELFRLDIDQSLHLVVIRALPLLKLARSLFAKDALVEKIALLDHALRIKSVPCLGQACPINLWACILLRQHELLGV